MPKKVRDIFPPQKIKREKEKEEKKEKVVFLEKKPAFALKSFIGQRKIPGFKKPLILFLFFLVLLGAFFFFTLPKAKIEIWPETQVLSLEAEITVDKSARENNFLEKIIPGQILEEEKTLLEIFESSGKALKETRAEGMIKVYNNYSTSPQVLVATTRFVSSEGKVFRTPANVTVPGGAYQGGKLVPGEIEIKVVADQPGPEYNIGPSTFSIPGFAGTDRYTKFYAKSFEPMKGGFSQEVAKVTREDIARAEEFLTKKGKRECQESLSDKLRSEEVSLKFGYLFEENRTEIIEKFSLAEAEEELKEFKFQVKTRCQILLFEKKDLENFAKELISRQVLEGNKLYQESLKTDYSAKGTDLDSGKMALSLIVWAKTYPQIDFNAFKNILVGKSLLEAKIFLENEPRIEKVEVDFWPFWVKKVPEDLDKIEIKTRID